MSNETRRFQWPLPAWNADWQKWQEIFADLTANIDSTVFAAMSSSKLIMKDIPNVEVREPTPGNWILEMKGPAVFVSRNLLTTITVPQESVSLTTNSILGLTFTPGAVGPQTASWEVFSQSMDNDPELVPVGYVDESYNIIWYNGAEIAAGGGVQKLFGSSSGASATDKVKITSADTLANYLASKISAGTNITLSTLNPGGNEQLQINAPAASVPTGNEDVYVDATNGSDVTGDGSIGNPYQTLAYAVTTITNPVNFAGFSTDLTFVLAPGTYSGAITLPYRLRIGIKGHGAVITGKITWGYDIQYWYGNSTQDNTPILAISPDVAGGIIVDEINCINDDPSNGTISPYARWLILDGCMLSGGDILNLESGATGAGESTGTLVLFAMDVQGYPPYNTTSGRLGGQRETSYTDDANYIVLVTDHCNIHHELNGCVGFYACSDTLFSGGVDYTFDPTDGTGSYAGAIGGSGPAQHLVNCAFDSACTMGWDGATGSTPGDIRVDANTHKYLFVDYSSTLDNISEVLVDVSSGVWVDSSSYTGILTGVDDAQEAFDILDNIPLEVHFTGTTTDATPTELTEPVSGRIIQANGNIGVAYLIADVVAKRNNDNVVHRSWRVKAVYQDDDGGSRSIITVPQDKETIYMSSSQNEPTWDVEFDYYAATGTPRIRLVATGQAGLTLRWEARVRVVSTVFDPSS